jgi:ketosteroid isomerase-like protein
VSELPAVVDDYQQAHDRRDADAALAAFTADAVVRDDGHEYQGQDEIRDWLARASVEFTYTRTLTSAAPVDATTWLVTNHLEGDFPGGVVDLRYRFVLEDGLIRELEIAP